LGIASARALAIFSGKFILIWRLSRPAGRSKRIFTDWSRNRQMQQLENHRLPVTALSVKKQTGKVRRLFWVTLNKIKIPLSMARANAAAIQNRSVYNKKEI
jgi:hypothetical protein